MTSTASPLNIAVMGAGAVGCYFGGMLARAGHRVTLIGRPHHVEAINRDGLRMETTRFDETIPLASTSDVGAVSDAQLVLFCVKSGDTEMAGQLIKPYLPKQTVVLCMQNGCDNDVRLRAVLDEAEVVAAVVYVGAEMAGPGHLKHHGRGELLLDPVRNIADLATIFNEAEIPAQLSDDVRGQLWLKLTLNCAYNAISAISLKPYGETVGSPGVQDVMRDVVNECLAIAKCEGITVPGDVNIAVRKLVEAMPKQMASTAQDLMRGKPTEIDFLNGHVVRRGKALGIPTPANQVLWALVKLVEHKSAS